MKLGIKVNADSTSFRRLGEANPQLAEVWFNANDPDRYTDLFAELTRRRCDVGLHFWGKISDIYLPNIAYPDPEIILESMKLMKQTIDIAAAHSFQYVNIHPGSSALLSIDYQAESVDIVREPVALSDSISIFIEHALILTEYARQKGIVFTVETVPPRITTGWYDQAARLTPTCVYELPVEAIIEAATAGIFVANDFTHTAANIISDDPDAIWTYVYGVTKKIIAATRLIHVGFIMPPYNGTDNHDELDNPILETPDAIPNTVQLIELLQLFAGRDDVWILAEPKQNHAKNYFILKMLLERASENRG